MLTCTNLSDTWEHMLLPQYSDMFDLAPIITCIIVIGMVVLVVAALPIIFLLPTFLAVAWLYAYKLGC